MNLSLHNVSVTRARAQDAPPSGRGEGPSRLHIFVPKFTVIFLALFFAIEGAAVGQVPAKGVVWQLPEDVDDAGRQLADIRNAGARAVRMDLTRSGALVPPAEILRLTDTMQINVYLDLPIAFLPGRRLLDTLAYASATLDTVLGVARAHPSLRHVGLSRFSDTSDSTACAYYERLVQAARERTPAGMRFYYTTRFAETDVCSSQVDFVLLDLSGRYDPLDAVRSWDDADDPSPVGIGALGTWVRRDGRQGLRVPHSPEHQARYLERHLSILFSRSFAIPLEAVFVFRWQDRQWTDRVAARDLDSPFLQRYGLHTTEGTPRPAREVVAGMFTGRQQVFAFPEGEDTVNEAPWTTLLGWGVVLLLGIFYATSPRFRHMIPRYFQAHVFFRESVREGRDVLFGTSAVLLTALGISTGLVFSVATSTLQGSDAFTIAFSWLAEPTQESVVAMLANPIIVALAAACIYVLALLIWTLMLALITRTRFPLAPSQVLMLVVWTRWPILLLLLAAMVVGITPNMEPTSVTLLVGVWLAIELLSAGRTLFDLVGVSRISSTLVIPGFLLHPVVLFLAAIVLSALAYQPEVTFLWHAFTRS